MLAVEFFYQFKRIIIYTVYNQNKRNDANRYYDEFE